jgi:hypothetical protein
MTEDTMTDEHESAFTDELATSLRATAALTPRTADPYGPLAPAIARDRRRRTGIGASLAVVAVLGAAVGIGSAVGRGGPASAQPLEAAAGTSTTAPPTTPTTPATSPASPATPPTSKSLPPTLSKPTAQETMLGWPTDFSLFPGYTTAKAQAEPTVNAMIHAYGKQVGQGTHNVLDELVGSFKLCGYPLTSYTFTLRWAGQLPHSGGDGAAVVDITHNGATYRMAGFDSYKGVWLQLPTAVTADQAARVEAVPLPELDQPAQAFYAAVVAAPGSKVTISGEARRIVMPDSTPSTTPFTDTATVGPSGVVEVKLTGRADNGELPYPTITTVSILRPDGSTGTVPLVGGTSTEQEQSARQLLPADTTCPGLHTVTPGS